MLLVAPGGAPPGSPLGRRQPAPSRIWPQILAHPPGQGLFLFKEISLATFPALKPKLADKTNTCQWPRLGF